MSERIGSVDLVGTPVQEHAPRPRLSYGISDASTVEKGTMAGDDLPKKKGGKDKPVRKVTSDEVVTKRNEELNMLLVLVGLLAATITAFIIYLQPQLKQDSGDTSAALLLALLYNTNSSLVGGSPPQIPDWQGAPLILTIAQIILYACLAGTLLCGWFALIYKFFTDSYALGWKNRFLDWVTRMIFLLMYLALAGVFFGIFVALTLQVPFLPSAALKALSKVHK